MYYAPAFESVVHIGEETRNAKTAVPFALFWSMVFNVAMGLVMILTFAVSFPDPTRARPACPPG